ncbi:MAG: serine/threonine protein kinase [Betaproteobacteria bacterium]|nr:serine/threonine protein kinase [Betaproteobacteria bacterium]
MDRVLGVGGFGLTYLATDTNLNLTVAVKEYLPSEIAVREADQSIHAKSEDDRITFDWGLARFVDEARTLATFRHPNIVRVMRFFQANKTAYMVMEFVRGAPLNEWIKVRRPLPQKLVTDIVLPLVEGLGTIHQAGYLHRDVKPGNIYIREDNSPVLLDFGAARAQAGNSEMTAVVSPGYAPLEQYSESGAQGPWSDLYALGGVIYWMVTGSKPVDATARVRNDPQKPALQVGDGNLYSAGFLQAIDWALEPDETKRPQSAQQFKAALSGVPIPDVMAAVPAPSEPSRTLPTGLVFPEVLSQPALDPSQLRQVESQLAQRIGPLASVLVRKAAKKHATVNDVVRSVAAEIPDEVERARFIKLLGDSSQPPTSAPSGLTQIANTRLALARFDAAVLAKAEKRLAEYIGAIARVVVKKAAAKARDESELYLLLADQIENADDRKAFVRKAISIKAKE